MPDLTPKAKASQEPAAARQADADPDQKREADPPLQLQHTFGNQAVLRAADQGRGALFAAAATTPAIAPSFAPARRFKDIWPEFSRARIGPDLAKAAALGRELADAPHDVDDLLNHGIDLVSWLERNGEPALAAAVLRDVRSAWMIQFASIGGTLPSRGVPQWNDADPATLITLGKEAARAGRHDEAVSFFGVASEILSYYALEASARRIVKLGLDNAEDAQAGGNDHERQALQAAMTGARSVARVFQYSDLAAIYDQMREIYGFYFVLEKEALAAGDAKGAADARAHAADLHQKIKDTFTWGQPQQAGGPAQEIREPAEIAEVDYTETPRGPGLELHGANLAETTLTALPGLPPPKEIGRNVQVQNLAMLQGTLMAQTAFQAELARQPAIRKAFGDKPVNLNDQAERQKAWQIMYGVFSQSGAGALGSLMALIGRYLPAFTVHTSYNVRDWGKSYLDTEMPTDLAGRAERDCGVYALTVAWDVYQTVKRGDAKLDVTFDLVTMLEHVTLVITDKSAGEFYVVNNDQVSPPHTRDPKTDDPLTQVAPQYQAVRGLRYTVGPAVTVSLGSTRDPRKTFHDQVWTRYQAATDWGLKPDDEELKKGDPVAALNARYAAFYREQQVFDLAARVLDPQIDALAPVAGDAVKLASALDPVVRQAGELSALFIRLGLSPGVVSPNPGALPEHAQYLVTMEEGHKVHPIARVALAILHLEALGGKRTPEEDVLVEFCKTIPIFEQPMKEFEKKGSMGAF